MNQHRNMKETCYPVLASVFSLKIDHISIPTLNLASFPGPHTTFGCTTEQLSDEKLGRPGNEAILDPFPQLEISVYVYLY